MCVRYNCQTRALEVWSKDDKDWLQVGDVFPGSEAPIVIGGQIQPALWGLTPAWSKDPLYGRKHAYNARAETVSEKPTFRSAFLHRRCLIPASSFYERAEGHWLRLTPTESSVLTFAGLWEPANEWSGGTTFTMVTTVPNALVGEVHDRMPVVLSPEDAAAWLDPMTNSRDLPALLTPCPPEWLRIEDAGPIRKRGPAPARLF